MIFPAIVFELAALMPDAGGFVIEGRDHMLAVGDRSFQEGSIGLPCAGAVSVASKASVLHDVFGFDSFRPGQEDDCR